MESDKLKLIALAQSVVQYEQGLLSRESLFDRRKQLVPDRQLEETSEGDFGGD